MQLEAEVEVLIILSLLMRHQYLDWVGPDMGLGVYTCDPDFYQEIGSLTKVPPDEKF